MKQSEIRELVRVIGRAARPAPAVVGGVPEHVRPLVARRAALAREIKQLDAALAALGVAR